MNHGVEDRFEAFLRDSWPVLQRVAEAFSSRYAQDAVQEALVTLCRNDFHWFRYLEQTMDSSESRIGWIVMVIRNKARDLARKDGRLVFLEDPPGPVRESEPPMGNEVDAASIEDIVQGLPPRLAEAVLGVHRDGLSRHECAAKLGITYGTLRNRLSNAYRWIRENGYGDRLGLDR